jgi:hypothetical protein
VESLFIAPGDGALYLVSKGRLGPIRLYRVPGERWQAGEATAELVQHVPFPQGRPAGATRWITGGAIRPDGRVVALRTEDEIYLFTVAPGGELTAAAQPCRVAGLEYQGEAVDFYDDTRLVLTSEAGRRGPGPIHLVRCALTN